MNLLAHAKGVLNDFVMSYIILNKSEKQHFRKKIKHELICLGLLDSEGKFIEAE